MHPTLEHRNFAAVFVVRPLFRAQGLRVALEHRKFTSVFGVRRSLFVIVLWLTLEYHPFATFFAFASYVAKLQFYLRFGR
jgi:hypothetical protein